MNDSYVKSTGTTTVGLVCKDSIVLAADMRMTLGHQIDRGDFDKVIPVSEKMAVTVAGSVASVQLLSRHLESELNILKIRNGREVTVKEAASMLRNWVYTMVRRSMFQDISHFILAGSDKHGVHMFDIFPDGSLTQITDYKVSGSGSPYAIGVMESEYKAGMSEADGIKLVEKALDVAIQKDSASGNGINLFAIDSTGVRKVLTKKVNTHLQ